MTFLPDNWTKWEISGLDIFIHRFRASWFVLNKRGKLLFDSFIHGQADNNDAEKGLLISRLPESSYEIYPGRLGMSKSDGFPARLRELWLHITDMCNLSCTHCLFASGPSERRNISFDDAKNIIDDAFSLGCRMFVLTGGEPFVHPHVSDIVKYVVSLEDCHIAVLTNGIFIEKMIEAKSIAPERVHLQISLDGLPAAHDRIRGNGSFNRTLSSMKTLNEKGFAFTVSMCVDAFNYTEMPGMVRLASDCGAENLHFMWYFVKGRGHDDGFVDPSVIFPFLINAAEEAEKLNINLDNISGIRKRIFSPQGTIHDGGGAAWDTLAVGPDMKLYPSAATIGDEKLSAGLEKGLERAWLDSPVFEEIRKTSIADLYDPFRFIMGGGDFDHSFIATGFFSGNDPYYQMYCDTALWLMVKEASKYAGSASPGLALKMGDILETCGEHGAVSICHSNCLIDVASNDARSSVASFYSKAASADSEDILNPVCYPDEYISHIPQEFRFRGYGCGSPVEDALIKEGEHVVDLGSGRGIECFIAARIVGGNGSVRGVDMLDPMLAKAKLGAVAVAENLGFSNLEFLKGYLEDLPIEEETTDVVISNCVLNLSPDKRRTFSEIFRILKKGGRIVASDVVCDEEPGAAIRNDDKLRGECIAGALSMKDLMGILRESGFEAVRIIKRFPYRNVSGHDFYSVTFSAYKPADDNDVCVIYRGAFGYAVTSSGKTLYPGIKTFIKESEAKALDDDVFVLDEKGGITNIFFGESSCCCQPCGDSGQTSCCVQIDDSGCCKADAEKSKSGCMVCGKELVYNPESTETLCSYCGKTCKTNAMCTNGHFVCDSCHAADALDMIKKYLAATEEKDMAAMFSQARTHRNMPLHGPEHHALVAGIVVAAYLNSTGSGDRSMILEAVSRASEIPGGSCGFSGVCGAASGAGTGFAVILGSSPVTPSERRIVQSVVHEILGEIAAFEASRCCQRDGWTALRKASEISEKYLGTRLACDHGLFCTQFEANKECIGAECPLFR